LDAPTAKRPSVRHDMPGRSGRKQLMGDDGAGEPKGDEYNDEPLTMQEKIENKRDEIQDDLDDTNDMINEAQAVGAATNKKLAMQNEQLRKADRDLDDIDENLDQAEHSLYRMEMCCLFALCCCCCHADAPKKRKKKGGTDDIPRAGQTHAAAKKKDRLDENDPDIDDEERHERKVANKLDDISDGLDVLNQLAKDQHEQLKETEAINKKLAEKIDHEKGRVKAADARGQKLLR